jgi:hypothetical protein
MTRLHGRRFGTPGQALLAAAIMVSLGAGSGCKKAAKNGDPTGSKSGPSDSVDAPLSPLKTTDGKMKSVAGSSKVDKSGSATSTRVAPGTMATTPPATTAPRPAPRPAAGPVKVQLVVGLNAAKLRKTFLWKKLLGLSQVKTLLSGKTYSQLKTGLGADPLLIVDNARIVLGGRSLNQIQKPEHLALFFSGRFDASATLKKLLTIPVKAGLSKPVLTKINGKDAIRGKGSKGDGFALIAVNKNTLAMCSSSMVAVVTTGDVSGGNTAIAKQIKATDTKALAWFVFGAFQVPLGSGGGSPALAALKKIQGGAVVLNSGTPKWKMVNRLDVGTPQAAKSLLQLVNMMKTAVARSGGRPGLSPALGALLANLTIVAKNQTLVATVELNTADVKTVLDTLLKKL